MENKFKDGKQVSESGIFKSILHKAEEYMKQPLRVNQLLNDAYKKASEKKDIGSIASEVWESMTTLFRMIKASMSGQYEGLPTPTIIGGIAVIIYFLTPIDFIPDFIPVLGLLDDVSLAAWFMTSIAHEIEKYSEWEAANPQPAQQASGSGKSENRHTTDTSFGTAKYEKEDHLETNKTTTMKEEKENKGWESKAEDKKASLKMGSKPLDDTYHDSDFRHVSDKNKNADQKNPNASTNQQAGGSAKTQPHSGAESTGAGEPSERANTTDSSRQHKHEEGPGTSGGNVR